MTGRGIDPSDLGNVRRVISVIDFQRFNRQMLERGTLSAGALALYGAYIEWTRFAKCEPASRKRFNSLMRSAGYELTPDRLAWQGVELSALGKSLMRGPEVSEGNRDTALRSGARKPRITPPPSSIAEDYATDPFYVRQPGGVDVVGAGCKQIRLLTSAPAGAVPADELFRALRVFLGVVDKAIVSGNVLTIDGEGFPALAFEQFVESLLFRAVIVAPASVAPGAIEIEGRAFFAPGDCDGELLPALLAGEHHKVFRLLQAHFTDPVWTLFQKQQWPGRADLFLSEVRRFGVGVSRAESSARFGGIFRIGDE